MSMKKSDCIIALFESEINQSEIAKHLKTTNSYVSRVISKYKKTKALTIPIKRGRPRSVTTTSVIKNVKQVIGRNPKLSTRKIGKRLNISRESCRKILKKELKLKPYKMVKRQLVREETRQKRLCRCKEFKKRFSLEQKCEILFTDEKLFTISQHFNRQNSRVWTNNNKNTQRIVHCVQKPKSLMVWAGVCRSGKTPLFFIEEGVKVNQEVYKELLAQKVLVWANKHFKDRFWTFQQDSAPSHTAKKVINFLVEKVPDIILPKDWPPSSPDLNPMDFSIWGILEKNACKKPHKSISDLKRSLKREWRKIDLHTIQKAVLDFHKRVDQCIKTKGGIFE